MTCCNKQTATPVPSAVTASSADRYARYPIEFVNHRRKTSTESRMMLLDQCIVEQNKTSVVFDRHHPAWKQLQQTKTRTKKAARGIVGVTRSILGVGLISIKARNERHDICLDCDQYSESKKKCKACGCIVALKIRSKHEQCPIGKW